MIDLLVLGSYLLVPIPVSGTHLATFPSSAAQMLVTEGFDERGNRVRQCAERSSIVGF
jgi:hypothetical protein